MTPSAGRPLVLVVDDDRDTREMYGFFLDAEGLDVITAPDAATAFELAVARQPRAVVTDLFLPGGTTGLDLCRQLHGDSRTAHIPALLLTGSARDGEVDRARAAGCAEVRFKPILPEQLVSDLRTLIGGAGAHGR